MDMGGSVNMLKLGVNILILHDHPLTRRQADQPWMEHLRKYERERRFAFIHMLCNATAELSFILHKSIYPPPQIQKILHIIASIGVIVF